MLTRNVLIAAGGVAAALTTYISMQPDTFHVERSITIDAPRPRVFAEVNDFRAWRAWSPWEGKDPAQKRTYSGPAAGVGSIYAWSGNREVGEGRMTIEKSDPAEVAIKLEFMKPFAATDRATYSFAEVPGGTRVTWAMDGECGFVSKALHLAFNVDKLLGSEFERGLVRMKAAVEHGNGDDAHGALADAASPRGAH